MLVLKELLVDWEGKTSWPYVLENLAKNNNLNINVDWTSKVVDVYSTEASKSQQLAMYEEDLDKERSKVLKEVQNTKIIWKKKFKINMVKIHRLKKYITEQT